MPPSKKKVKRKPAAKRATKTRKAAKRSSAPSTRKASPRSRSSKKRRSGRKSPTLGVEPLSVEALRWRCDPAGLPFASTSELEPIEHVVGQDAAVESLAFGLESTGPGQNVFIRGLSGTGRLTLVRRLLDSIHPYCPQTKDCCYVHNFAQPERPRLLMFAPGLGQDFRHLMDKLADFIRDDLQSALSSEGVSARRSSLEQTTQKALEDVVGPFEASLQESDLTMVTVEAGPVLQTAIFPLVEGRAVAPEEFEQMHTRGEVPDEDYRTARENYKKFEHQLAEVNDKADEIRRAHAEAVNQLMEKAARSIMLRFVRMIESAFPQAEVHAFLNELVDDVATHRLGGLERGQRFHLPCTG